MNMSEFFGCSVLSIFALTGCRDVLVAPGDDMQNVVDHEIALAADRLRVSQMQLAQAGALNQGLPAIDPAKDDIEGPVSVAWDGDAVPLLKRLAAERQISFSSIGPRLPLPVSLHVEKVSLESVLQALQTQIAYRASMEVTATAVTLRYVHAPL